MKHWRVRTTLMVSLLAASLGLTATCLLIIRIGVQQQIQKDLNSDLEHSLSTFKNIARQRNIMLAREAALMSDLPSLKALMATQDPHTIQDGSGQFWKISGSDLFALASPSGSVFTYSNRGTSLDQDLVRRGLRGCANEPEVSCLVAFGPSLYEVSVQPIYFGPPANGTMLGYVIIGYAIDHDLARQVSEAAAADVTFLVDNNVSASTLPAERFSVLQEQSQSLDPNTGTPRRILLNHEANVAAALALRTPGSERVTLVVLKSYDRASEYLRRVNRWVMALGIAALLIGLLLAAAISRAVTRPIEMLVAGTRALGQGDFNYQLNIRGAAEVRELALAFDNMRGQLKRGQKELLESDRLATIGRMASSVSHDLRHHLSAIYANAEFMSLPKIGEVERLELHAEIREAVQSMTDLIESLLLFSQTGQALNLLEEPVHEMLERVIHNVSQHPDARDVTIEMPYRETVLARIDRKKLGRALYNLLLNACQAARSGLGLPKVTVILSENDDHIRISIRDSGPGVPNTIRQTLFQPFVSAGKENGVGLGLTLAQHIAQEHGGEVRLEESMPGRTVFTILLYKQALESFGRSQTLAATSSIIQEQTGTAGRTGMKPELGRL